MFFKKTAVSHTRQLDLMKSFQMRLQDIIVEDPNAEDHLFYHLTEKKNIKK